MTVTATTDTMLVDLATKTGPRTAWQKVSQEITRVKVLGFLTGLAFGTTCMEFANLVPFVIEHSKTVSTLITTSLGIATAYRHRVLSNFLRQATSTTTAAGDDLETAWGAAGKDITSNNALHFMMGGSASGLVLAPQFGPVGGSFFAVASLAATAVFLGFSMVRSDSMTHALKNFPIKDSQAPQP